MQVRFASKLLLAVVIYVVLANLASIIINYWTKGFDGEIFFRDPSLLTVRLDGYGYMLACQDSYITQL